MKPYCYIVTPILEAHDFQEGADDSAAKSGYSYEYIQKVASYTGWRYQYVYGEWEDLYEKLKTGEIDLMAGISYDDDRVNSMLFPEYEMINETFYVYKDTDDTSMKCGNIDSYAGKKIFLKYILKRNDGLTQCHMPWEKMK